MEPIPVDYRRKWYVMLAVGLGIFLSTIDGSIVNVSLPTLVLELKTSFAAVQWVVLAYLLTLTTLMLSVGRLADMYGKKPVYVAGFAVFTVGSMLCGLAPNVYWLIGLRVFQALGAVMLLSLGTAIVTEAFPPGERGQALGISGTIVSIGIVLGPTLGGLILSMFSWRWIFYVNLPVGLLGTCMALWVVPAVRPRGGQRFDYGGAGAFLVGLLGLLLALTLGQQIGFGAQAVWGLLGLALAGLLVFLWLERRVAQPMIDLRLFRNTWFSVNLLTGLLTFVCSAGTFFLLPFYLENVLRHTPREVGLLLGVVPLVMGVVAPLAGGLSDRWGTRLISLLGLVGLLGGYWALSSLGAHTSVWGYVLRMVPVGLGMGIFQSPNNSAIMGAAPREQLGVVSSLLALSRTLGQTTGIAVLGAVWAARVAAHAAGGLTGSVTTAAVAAQVAGLHDVLMGVLLIITAAVGLSILNGVRARWTKRGAAAGQSKMQ